MNKLFKMFCRLPTLSIFKSHYQKQTYTLYLNIFFMINNIIFHTYNIASLTIYICNTSVCEKF